MHDDMVSRAFVVAVLLWAWAVALVVVTWVLAVVGAPLRYEGATGLTAILSLAWAMVWQSRLYALRISALIRVVHGLDGPDASLHTIGRRL